ncbi:hypothetical protein K402DRAFT_421360 [Aulographum hederae CBS 113979]|uniref:Uncharacterized protein n=1 Tax=Aulographum hederae CBS 113979 TaxID=1176131 RepID=A0A6G1GZE0_9PEZI|nr:hypothetical protein K402DRAFT_421360 [Aulographum hederae CBS 113979]
MGGSADSVPDLPTAEAQQLPPAERAATSVPDLPRTATAETRQLPPAERAAAIALEAAEASQLDLARTRVEALEKAEQEARAQAFHEARLQHARNLSTRAIHSPPTPSSSSSSSDPNNPIYDWFVMRHPYHHAVDRRVFKTYHAIPPGMAEDGIVGFGDVELEVPRHPSEPGRHVLRLKDVLHRPLADFNGFSGKAFCPEGKLSIVGDCLVGWGGAGVGEAEAEAEAEEEEEKEEGREERGEEEKGRGEKAEEEKAEEEKGKEKEKARKPIWFAEKFYGRRRLRLWETPAGISEFEREWRAREWPARRGAG